MRQEQFFRIDTDRYKPKRECTYALMPMQFLVFPAILIYYLALQMRKVIILCQIIVILSAQCILNSTIDCTDPLKICENYTSIISTETASYDCPLSTLVLSANSLNIKGFFSSVSLIGVDIVIANVKVTLNLNINVNNSLTINSAVEIGGMLLVNSNSGQNLQTNINGANIISEKIIMIGSNFLNIQASNLTTTWTLCLYERINIIAISSAVQSMIETGNITALSNLNFSIFIVTQNTTLMQSSILNGVSIGIISFYNISVSHSNINATAQSCKTNSGLGRGAIIQYNNNYCTSGSSSCGFGVISNSAMCSGIIQYFLFLSHSFPYINKGPYLSTGSGGYGYNPEMNGRGAGGGIIFMLSKNYLLLSNSSAEADGGNVESTDNLSAGSGGTVFITAKSIQGQGLNNITATGGNSSNNKGGGGGGLIKISYNTVSQYPDGSLWVDINQGYQQNSPNNSIYSNGIFYGPLCQGGTQSYYLGCSPCNSSTFSTLGDPVCRQCPPSEEFEVSLIQNKSLLSECYQIKKQVDYLQFFSPGDISFLNIALYLAALVIFTVVGVVLKKKIKKQKLLSGEEFKLEDVQKDIEKAKILALELRKSKDIKPYELMYHAHRISCFGSNSQSSPWVLPNTVPLQVRKFVLPQVYSSFAESFNQQARWTKLQYWLSVISTIIYPVYWFYLDKVKKRKYKKLNALLQNSIDYNLINNYDYEDRSIVTIKFSKNKDYTNCYLDFFVYERADLKYFTLASPFILYLSGEGNFLRPFYLQEGDIFFRLMFFVVNRQYQRSQDVLDEKKQLFNNMVSQKKKQKNNFQLNRFLRKLNTLACTLDLSSTSNEIVEVLWSLVEFIEKWNQQFFNKMAVHLDLVIFMSKLMNKTVIDNQIQILTKKDKQLFKNFILGKIKEIQSWEQSSMKIGLFVYNPEQEIPKQEDPRRSLLEQSQLLSNDDNEDSYLKSHLIYHSGSDNKKIHQKIFAKFVKFLGLFRYFMMSHKKSKYDEYTIKYLQSLFILMQTMLVFIWSIKIEIPYLFVNLVMPFIGIIWFVSDSYGFGKLYLIFNAMSFVNQIVTLITYSSIETTLPNNDDNDILVVKNIICSTINICIIVFMMFLGNRAITQSKKLSLKKEDDNQPLKFQ